MERIMSSFLKSDITNLNESNVPRHIAIIMDGNGRWAKKRGLPRFAGHRMGLESVRKAVSKCTEYGVEVLTLFAFSSENWHRPKKEVNLLMDLFLTALKKEVKKLHKNKVKLTIIGGREAFSEKIQARIAEAESLTAENDGLNLVIAANYGGRWDVLNSMRQIGELVKIGDVEPQDIDEALIHKYMALSKFPEPDLFVRTGGEKRISNFLLWDLAYTELYFTDVLWPDFDQAELDTAIDSFAHRQRRFGMTGEQVERVAGA